MKKIIQFWKALPTLGKVCLVIVFLALYSILFGMYEWNRGWKDATEGLKKDTVIKEKIEYDTITSPPPPPAVQHIVKTITDTFTINRIDTLYNTVEVQVPITQKEYRDSNYAVWVSGYKPNLDSIHTYNKTITIEKEITKTAAYKKKWTIGIQGGYGFGFKSKNFEPFVGLGINYRIF